MKANPEKQGLKRKYRQVALLAPRCRESESRKTRIETLLGLCLTSLIVPVVKANPEKQGLKRTQLPLFPEEGIWS